MLSLLRNYSSNKFRKKVEGILDNGDVLRLNVGAGGTTYEGWLSAEKRQFDITQPERFGFFFRDRCIQNVLAEHVIEHIYKQEFEHFLLGIRQCMREKGCIRIAVPDAFHPSSYVRNLTRPGGLEPGADDHKEFYSINCMIDVAERTEYALRPIEYFDADGVFRYKEQDWDNGYISRSFRNYSGRFTSNPGELRKLINTVPVNLRDQFVEMKMSYTSLIVDFVCI